MTANEIYNMGYEYYEQKKYSTAFELFQKASNMGCPPADNMLGLFYRKGLAGKTDYALAMQYYEKSRSAGNGYAANNLGVLYENGYGVQRDVYKAMELYREAQRKGCPDGTKNLQRLQSQYPTGGAPKTSRFCIHCGAELTPNAKWCAQCGNPVAPASGGSRPAAPQNAGTRYSSTPASAPTPAPGKPTGNVLLGILGALGGAALAAAAIVLIGQLGYVAALGGVLLGSLPVLGYAKFGGKLSWGSLLFCIALVLVTPYVATQLNMAFIELRYYGQWYFSLDPYVVDEELLLKTYAFTALGAFAPLKAAIRGIRQT